MRKTPNHAIIHYLLLALVLTCCQDTPRQPSVTFSSQGCSYAGPDRISPQFTITWEVEDSVEYGAIMEIFSIDATHDLDDLSSMPAAHPLPGWITKLSYDFASKPGNYTTPIDLTSNAAWAGEEIYIVCFSSLEETALNAFGPIKVKN